MRDRLCGEGDDGACRASGENSGHPIAARCGEYLEINGQRARNHRWREIANYRETAARRSHRAAIIAATQAPKQNGRGGGVFELESSSCNERRNAHFATARCIVVACGAWRAR